ncbi:MAG: hypothetical protein ABI896_10480 [Actinomycetota bacterium]
MTLDQYDKVAAELQDDAPEGLILHTAGAHASGIRIMDVWESEDAYMRFRDGRLRSAIEKVIGRRGRVAIRDRRGRGDHPRRRRR